ncbi:MAG TPA: carboxypeptidase-like regulatory domain-containing protein [Bryobacteraceae bacterium]|jgi:hypothetical protein
MMRAIVIAGLIAMQARGQAPAPNPAGGSLSGRVTNSVTGAGIEGARVRACVVLVACLGPDANLEALSDAAGAFRIDGIPDGQYMIDLAPLQGFMPAFVAQLGPSPTVRVSGDTRLDLQMTPSASIRGRVLDPEGMPAAGVMVKIDGQGCKDCAPLDLKEADEDGEFVFENVPPGFPVILSATPKPQANAADETRIVTTYYPSVIDLKQATVIKHQGLDLIGYDIRLQTALGRAIRGVVIGVDGKPARAAMVSVSKPLSGMVAMIRGAWYGLPDEVTGAEPGQTRSDGKFVFPPVLEGDWRVRAVQRQDDDLAGGAGAVEVSLSKNDIDDLEIHLTPPFVVEVTADWGDSPPAKPPLTLATVRPLDVPQVGVPFLAESGKPQRLEVFPGRYFIAPPGALTPGFYAAAAILENRDVLGQVVELSGPTSIQMIFKSGGGGLRGTVEKGANALVILMADPTSTAQLGYAGSCDANGAFFVPDLPPGEYTVVALQGQPGDPLRPEFTSLLTANGKRVKVESGSTTQVELRLARQP